MLLKKLNVLLIAKKPLFVSSKSLSAIGLHTVFLLYNLYIFVWKSETMKEENWLRAELIEMYLFSF